MVKALYRNAEHYTRANCIGSLKKTSAIPKSLLLSILESFFVLPNTTNCYITISVIDVLNFKI